MSRRYNLGDPLMNKAAANNMKGVVGKPGTKMPTIPSAQASMPPTIKRSFFNFFIG